MAQARTASGPIEALAHAVSTRTRAATRKVRVIVVLSVILIGGSFASAAIIQMRLDHTRALNQAADLEARRAQALATDFSATLERYAALGTAFATTTGTAETSAALSEAGGAGLKNVAILAPNGQLQYEMKSDPSSFLPLSARTLREARRGRAAVPGIDGHTMVIAFSAGSGIVAMHLDLSSLIQSASMDETVIAMRDGSLIALGSGWRDVPPVTSLAGSPKGIAERVIDLPNEHRLVALAPVPEWPLTFGASVQTGEALDVWYGSLPLYFFFIFGPALAGGGLAVVFVREFERRAKTAEAVKSLRATRPDEARLYIRLADAERRAIEAERAKTEFIAHMSHELRTPLNAIIGFSEVIEQGMFGAAGHPKYVEYARDINAAGRALHGKISDILDFADLEAGRHPLDIAPIDIAAIARAVIADSAGRAFLRRIKLTVALPDASFALADRSGVKRVLSNLLTNALQYTPEHGAVRIQIRNEPETVVVVLRDNGLGFSQREIDSAGAAFSSFSRPGATTGSGLGLAISMVLARRMHGSVEVASIQGEGTTAELRLPSA
jgi:signal transduction histidine kinase